MKFIQKIQFWKQSYSRSYLRRIEKKIYGKYRTGQNEANKQRRFLCANYVLDMPLE